MSPRDHAIIAAIESGERLQSISIRFGLHHRAIRKIAAHHGVEIPRHSSGPPKAIDEEAQGPLALRIGRASYRWRDVEHGLPYSEAGRIPTMPPQRVVKIERGTVQLILAEIERIAAALGTSPSELLA